MAGGGRALRIGMVAGEASGDRLGAGLIDALRRQRDDLVFEGVGGPLMTRAGLRCWAPAETLAVLGITEVIAHLPRLWGLRRTLLRRWQRTPPDLFIGIDAPDFNLGLEHALRRGGVRTLHYVSPSVWAWRSGRARRMAAACEGVLCLLPFEPEFYAAHGIAAEFVGHPLADVIPADSDPADYRAALGLSAQDTVVALMPGSRRSEIKRLGPAFAGAAAWLAARRPELKFIAPMVGPTERQRFADCLQANPGVDVRLLDGRSQECLGACDVALVASGTATLEAALWQRPMVVAYRISRVSLLLARRLGGLRLRRYALPNLIADETLVPELLMDAVTPEALGAEALAWLSEPARQTRIKQRFRGMHQLMRRGASERAARVVLDMLGAAPSAA